MRVLLLRPGHFKEAAASDLTETWLSHAGRYCRVDLVEVTGPALKRARDAAQRQAAEAELLDKAIPRGAILVAADSRGTPVDSPWFAHTIDGARNGGRDLVFLVGGPSGLTDALRARADHLVAFGRITLNHDLAVAVLAEQIWRGLAILHNHPYHNDHA
ncbi:MAG: 23S rRNA (pseudouridine(1915)-N(3))-methyltransferase RlmH [Pseudomonadota bacterium]